jgi:hypothetical protein
MQQAQLNNHLNQFDFSLIYRTIQELAEELNEDFIA